MRARGRNGKGQIGNRGRAGDTPGGHAAAPIKAAARAAVERLEQRRLLTAGGLDVTFGTGGRTVTNFVDASLDFAETMTLQPDGRIIVVGHMMPVANATPFHLAMARYNTDGTLDTGFGNAGTVASSFGQDSYGEAVAIDAAGRILVAGMTVQSGDQAFLLTRYTPNGTLDTTFGSGGAVITNFPGGHAEHATGIALIGDKILLGGQVYTFNNYDFALARFNADGTLDPTFGNGGTVLTNFAGSDSPTTMAVDGDKIILAGQADEKSYRDMNDMTDFALARYNANGTLDTSFGGDGKVTTNFFAGHDSINHILVHDGKVLAAGFVEKTPGKLDYGLALARYDRQGNLDTTFSEDGWLFTPLVDPNRGALALDTSGRIIVGGAARLTDGTNRNGFALAAYTQSGNLDASFGTLGTTLTPFVPSSAYVSTLAMDPQGRLVAAGTANADFALARYEAAVNLAPLARAGGPYLAREGAVLQLDGSQSFDPGGDSLTYSWDFNADGAPDSSDAKPTLTWAQLNGLGLTQIGVTYPISLRVDDGRGASATASSTMEAVPLLTISGGGSVAEGSEYCLTLDSWTGVGPYAAQIYTVQWGDGTAPQHLAAADLPADGKVTHTYADGNATQTVSVSVAAEATTYENAASKTITVADVAPTMTVTGADSVNEGDYYTFTFGPVTDPGADTLKGYIIFWRGYDKPATFIRPEDLPANRQVRFRYDDGDPGNPPIDVRVDLWDEDGFHRITTKTITVNPVPPTVVLGGADSVAEGGSYQFFVTISNASYDPISSVVVNWGDGTSEQLSYVNVSGGSNALRHVYADAPLGGIDRTISVDVVDTEGAYRPIATKVVAVVSAAPDAVQNATRVDTLRINNSAEGNQLGGTAAVGKYLYFQNNKTNNGGAELWRTDGTPGGATFVHRVPAFPSGDFYPSGDLDLWSLTEVDGDLYFFVSDLFADPWQSGTTARAELWKTEEANGTTTTTSKVGDFNPDDYGGSRVRGVSFNGQFYFSATTAAAGGQRLFRTRAGPSGETTEWIGGTRFYSPDQLTVVKTQTASVLYFTAYDSLVGRNVMCRYDGTSAEPEVVYDEPAGSYPYGLTDVNGKLHFFAVDPSVPGDERMKSFTIDGASGSVTAALTFPSRHFLTQGTSQVLNGALYFQMQVRDSAGNFRMYLWHSNGTEAGTGPVVETQFAPRVSANGLLYGTSFDSEHGVELWRSDGTAAGTHFLADIAGGRDHSFPSMLTAFDDTVYFAALAGNYNGATCDLWNVRSTKAVSGSSIGAVGQTIQFSLRGLDASSVDMDAGFTYRAHWADGGGDRVFARSPGNATGLKVERTFTAAGTYTLLVEVEDKDGATTTASHTITIGDVLPASTDAAEVEAALESLAESAEVPGQETQVAITATTSAEVKAVLTAVSNLEATASEPLRIVLDADGNSFTGQSVSVPQNVTLVINGATFTGASPALKVLAGDVLVVDSLLTNNTNAPTILVLGGRLTLRNSTVEESSLYAQAAIEIAGGSVDLGNGDNTLVLRGDGQYLRNATATVIAAVVRTPEPSVVGATSTALVVAGTEAGDDLQISADGAGVRLNVGGVSKGSAYAASRIVVIGGGGDDNITVASAVTVPAWLYGGAGADKLNAGSGSAVVIGGAGNDFLNGGSARDILVGGDGADRVVGNAGDDILIAGYTTHDDNEAALGTILAEWKSTRSYVQRTAIIRGDAGAPVTLAFRFGASTVLDDRQADQIDILTGSAGEDWFWADRSGGEDKVTGVTGGEQVQEI